MDNGRLSLKDIMTVGMVDVSWLKLFHSHYGKKDDVGKELLTAQRQCFLDEEHGTCISTKVATSVRGCSHAIYPILGPDTTEQDLKEAQFVMNQKACTFLDYEAERTKPVANRWKLSLKSNVDERKKPPSMTHPSLTSVAARMKSEIEASVEDSDIGMIPTEDEKDTYYKKWQEDLKSLLCNERVDAAMMKDIDTHMSQLVQIVNDLTLEDGDVEQNDGCLEMFGNTSSYSALVARKRGAL